MSFSTTETAIASSSYIDTIIANLHIQADTMMEEIYLDTSDPTAAPTAFYSNKTLFAPLSPPGKNNGSGLINGNGSNSNWQRTQQPRWQHLPQHHRGFPRRHHQRRLGSPAMADV
jgi:hypothetical protein